MKTFEFEIKEILAKTVKIEADDFEDAYSKIKGKYNQEEFILDYSDYVDTEIELISD